MFVAAENPGATIAQALRYGLFLPPRVDPAKNLVILMHGLDCDVSMLHPMGAMLEEHGVQVAYFSYPADQPVDDDVKMFEDRLHSLRQAYPGIRLDLVGHSMGGLVARAYVEGNAYAGDVDHLILVGTPNNGSPWARFDPILKAQKAYYLSRSAPDWHWSWMVTEGLGDAAHDIVPHSKFLNRLNAEPRRAGVRYTIIAGSHSAVASVASSWLSGMEQLAPPATRQWWGIHIVESGLATEAQRLADRTGPSDGPVSVRSAKLAGVTDVVVVPADHCSLFIGSEANPPAALPVILARLNIAAR
jgi:pimeloyl-ACP methyl ester carboxylesterase